MQLILIPDLCCQEHGRAGEDSWYGREVSIAAVDSNHCTAVHQQDTLDTGQTYLALRKTCLVLNSANI